MSKKLFFGALAPIVCLLLFTGSASAQSPTSKAENADEYYAYVHSYIAMVEANGIANVMNQGVQGDVAELVAGFTQAGFKHCYVALMKDNDDQWREAAKDLEMALFWSDTLLTYAQTSQSSTTIQNIESLQWRLELAIERAYAAAPRLRPTLNTWGR